MRYPAIIAAILTLAGAQPAAAFTCTVTVKGDAVIIRTDNPYAKPATCTVSCRFNGARRQRERRMHARNPRPRQELVRLPASDRRQGL